jgi:uncharacterized PurR-regulated membrane protein YhhQ (DUF165 family)
MLCIILSVIITTAITWFPYDPVFQNQSAFEAVFSIGPITAFATILAFAVGGLVNDFTVAKLKIADNGRAQEKRFILSTFLGQSADNVTGFLTFAILTGLYADLSIASMIATAVIFCTIWEIIAIPLTRIVVRKIKEVENLVKQLIHFS